MPRLFSRPALKRKDSRSPSPEPLPPDEESGTGVRSLPLRSRSKRGNGSDERGQGLVKARGNARTVNTDPPSLSSSDHGTNNNNNMNNNNNINSPLQHRNSPASNSTSNACNNFLLGGNYYPGKDKKRRHTHLRQRNGNGTFGTFGRVFCSSPGRIILTAIVGTYIGVWYVLVPLSSLLFYYGKVLSGWDPGLGGGPQAMRLSGDWLLREGDLKIPSLQEEQRVALKMEVERDRIYHHVDHHGGSQQDMNGHETRMKILEEIAPDWFHRNNPKLKIKEPTTTTGAIEGTQDSKHKFKKEDEVEVDRPWDTIPAEPPDRQLRTLQTMHLMTNHTSCPADLSASNVQITLVVQASLNRVWVLDETCARWKDPIVLVVVLTDEESHHEDTATSLMGWKDKCPQLKLIKHTMQPGEDSPELYPVNHLRNIGLDAVDTSHVLVIDVDFVPSAFLDKTIHATLQERSSLRENKNKAQHRQGLDLDLDHYMWPEEKEALVVPAFERLLESPCTSDADCMHHLRQNSSFVPHTFEALKECVAGKDCIVFQSNVNWEGHHSTRSETWLAGEWYDDNLAVKTDVGTNTTLRSIKTVKCFDSFRYEPYVVLRWCPVARNRLSVSGTTEHKPERVAPYYDERFHGYGKNKIQHIAHLRMLGYQFAILPEGFVTHNPHRESKAKETWNNVKGSELHAEMDKLYPKFLKELLVMYRDTKEHIVELC